MNLTNEQFIVYIEKCKQFVDEITLKYNYTSNISHLLYVIVPAFVFKYGFREENYILDVFRNVEIIIEDRHDLVNQASFNRELSLNNDGFITKKRIYLYNYENVSLLQLMDNLIHEFNHAVNSLKQEVVCSGNHIFVRTGLSRTIYDSNFKIVSSLDVVLEEIINTKQVENIIDLICSFKNYQIEDNDVNLIVFSIIKMIDKSYKSNSYYLESKICKEILDNKTFICTLEILRYNGECLDIDNWFDGITGIAGSYKQLNELLNKTMNLEYEIRKRKIFKFYFINKLSNYVNKILNIVAKFNENCNYK